MSLDTILDGFDGWQGVSQDVPTAAAPNTCPGHPLWN